mmetsp:Transcript_7432/g.15508  ORF Transcript_7432/g.15508 Transcript_7432/m.15508 type:complete len:373 (-) Transcript_7432:132-1250(-)|eukprot:CAMPEP_0172451014 /NCGR_PEP_ID=MMETSP1065-20121228/9185_1 /TAXON_ID=265537 /ORGANISM="Amphiprora paludosa, Strain CCMP125" /LENGTH=372 /DNA_ID=CAMNT_0013202895 /DNA_START=22 /DNA_END=1140 /DNA_ORIENTATION=+
MSQQAIFNSTSKDEPSLLNISFASDPKAGLGAQLVNCDKDTDTDYNMFCPGYAVIGKVLPGDTVAKRAGVSIGDHLVAVNGTGFRRFAPDYKFEEVKKLNEEEDVDVELDNRIVSAGGAYDDMLSKIKSVKAAGDPPLVLSLERYEWDARPNAWRRFLDARDGKVPDAMMMCQQHEQWRSTTFPIDLTAPGLQKILKSKAVSEIHVESTAAENFPPTVYINYGTLISMQSAGDITADDVTNAFVMFTERMLRKAKDPRHPKTCQFIDLSDVSITSGFRVESLKKIYSVFEPNYPETLYKMVMYPVSTMLGTTARTLLSFVNEKTQSKFLITNSLDQVCSELGWNKDEVDECGGITDFMAKHEEQSTLMVFND